MSPAPRRLAALTVTLAFLAIGAWQVLAVDDDILRETHPEGCTSAAVSDLQARPWDHTTAVEVATAVEGWHARSLDGADPSLITRVAPCASRLTAPATSDASTPAAAGGLRFASVREIYDAALWWRALVVTPLLAALLGAIARAARRLVPLALPAALIGVGTVSAWAQDLALLRLLRTAWDLARRNGAVDATRLDPTVLNLSGSIAWTALATTTALLLAVGWRPAMAWASRMGRASRGVRFHIGVATAFAGAMVVLPQAGDAIRQWEAGQAALSVIAVLVLGAAIALGWVTTAVAGPPAPSTLPARWIDRAIGLSPLLGGALLCVAAAAMTGRQGLLIPAALLTGMYILSIPLDADAAQAPGRRAMPVTADQRRLLAAVGALCPAAVGGRDGSRRCRRCPVPRRRAAAGPAAGRRRARAGGRCRVIAAVYLHAGGRARRRRARRRCSSGVDWTSRAGG